jgi:serine/threonine-protein kinase
MRDLIGRTLGHYRIVDKIGEGGMGVVRQAFNIKLEFEVALKALLRDLFKPEHRLVRLHQDGSAAST